MIQPLVFCLVKNQRFKVFEKKVEWEGEIRENYLLDSAKRVRLVVMLFGVTF